MKHFTQVRAIILVATALFFGIGNLFGQACPDGMISYYKMQETNGPSYLDSYGSHDAFAPNSSPVVTQGVSGNAQLFSSANSTYITIPDNSAFDWGGGSSFSIEFWVKYSGTTGKNQVFIGRDETSNQMQWWIGSSVTGKLTWYIKSSDGSNGSFSTDASFNNGAWHHVVAVRDGTVGRNYLYVDGTLQNPGGTGVTLGGNLASNSSISIGSLIYSGVPDYFATGAIDEVAFYSRALDANNDIIPHYNNQRLYQIGYCDGDDPLIISSPVNEAIVGQLYSYNVDASGNSLPTYSLINSPTGMTINSITGQISWTPTSVSQNGHVIVRATNDKGFVEQEFNIYIADTPECRDNLIAYWDFNSTDPPPKIDKIAGYQLTGVGPSSIPGISGNGLLFDGINDSLNMHDTFSPDKVFFDFDDVPNFSIELWVKTSTVPDKTMVLVGREVPELSTQYWVGINPDGTVSFFLRDWPADPEQAHLNGGSVIDGNWHHIVASYSKTARQVKLHVDMVLVDNDSKAFYNFGGRDDLNIGMLNTSIDKYWFKGVIDELAFYNTQLSDLRVQENYTNGFAGLGACVYNHAPVITSTPDSTVEQGGNYSYRIVASELDPDDIMVISAVSKPEWLTLDFTSGETEAVLSGIPSNEDVGMNNVIIRVSDGSVNVDQQFEINVINVNDEPVITSSPLLEIDQGADYSYTVVAEDPDVDDVLVYSAPQMPTSFSFDESTHVLSGIPTNDDVGIVDITVRVSDGTVEVDQVFQITVIDVNDAPVITSTPELEIYQGEDYSYTLIANDPDGDEITYSAPVLPGWLTFDINTHKLSGKTDDFLGLADVTLRVTDGVEIVDQVFQINVKNVNDPPVITSVPITSVRAKESYLYQFTATDADPGDKLTFTAESIPPWLTFTPASNSAILSGNPQVSDIGSYAVILKVSDGIDEEIDAFTIRVRYPVGIDDVETLVESVYPNPAIDVVYFNLAERSDALIEIFDLTGVTLKLIEANGNDLVEVDITDLDESIYFYKITVDGRSTVGKFMKN